MDSTSSLLRFEYVRFFSNDVEFFAKQCGLLLCFFAFKYLHRIIGILFLLLFDLFIFFMKASESYRFKFG